MACEWGAGQEWAQRDLLSVPPEYKSVLLGLEVTVKKGTEIAVPQEQGENSGHGVGRSKPQLRHQHSQTSGVSASQLGCAGRRGM